MMNSVESSRSPNLGDFLCLRSKMSLMFLIFYSSPSSFVGDSSHSSPCMEGRCNGKPIPGAPGDMDTGPVGDNPRPPGALLMCLDASRRNPNMLRPTTRAATASIIIVAGVKLTSAGAVEPDHVVA